MNRRCTVSTARQFSIGVVVMVAAGLTNSAPAWAQWTQWGGPGQSFVAESSGLASSWPEEGPKEVWGRDLGEGYSAILVDGDRLYTMYRKDDKETVISLEAATGKTVWEHKYDSAPDENHTMQFGDGPRATPLIVDGRLFTIGISGTMHCLDKYTGKVHWTKELWRDLKGNILPHGYCSSPIAYKDTVIVLIGAEAEAEDESPGDDDSIAKDKSIAKDQSIAAFKQSDGSVVWQKHSYENSYSSPKLINVDGEDQLAVFMATELVGLDPNNGNLKWEYAISNQWKQNVCMPVLGDDNHLFFSTSDAGSRGVKLTRDGDKTTLEELWSTNKIRFYHVTSVLDGHYVYGSSGSRDPTFFSAINIDTGKIAWRKRGFSKATCLRADGRLIILDENGQLALATATPEDFTVHSKFKVSEGTTWTVPTVAGKRLYFRDKERIRAFDLG